MSTKDNFNLGSLFWSGIADDRAGHMAGEAAKLGNLRAGDSGAMTKQGDVVGGCPRRAYVRSMLGIEAEVPEQNNLLMFEVGKANEVIWLDKLKRSWPGLIKQEEEIPISWTTGNGTKVTGRPDIVLCNAEGKPLLGIEHKAVCSLWTARDVTFEGTPKLKHLLQAAHYMWKLNVPYRLVYTQYVQYSFPDWAAKMFPAKHPAISLNDKGQPKAVLPHITIYELAFDKAGLIQYRIEGETRWTTAAVGRDDIERYYEFASVMAERKALGPRPAPVKADGSKAGYSDCNYCPLVDVCNSYENKWEKWHDEIKARYTGQGQSK